MQHLRFTPPPHNPDWYPPEQDRVSSWQVPPILTQGSSFSEKIAVSYSNLGSLCCKRWYHEFELNKNNFFIFCNFSIVLKRVVDIENRYLYN